MEAFRLILNGTAMEKLPPILKREPTTYSTFMNSPFQLRDISIGDLIVFLLKLFAASFVVGLMLLPLITIIAVIVGVLLNSHPHSSSL